MALARITEWLNGSRNYTTGLELLKELSEESFLIRMLSKGSSPFNQQKLAESLSSLNTILDDRPEVIRFTSKSDAIYQALPENVKLLKKERDDLYKEGSFLHSRLLDVSEQQRGKDANRIEEIFDRIDELHRQLDYFAAHQELPEKVVPIKMEEMNIDAMKLRVALLRSYISKGYYTYKKEKLLLEEKIKACSSTEKN